MNDTNEQKTTIPETLEYSSLLRDVIGLVEHARHTSARAVNALMTATY